MVWDGNVIENSFSTTLTGVPAGAEADPDADPDAAAVP